MNVAVTTRGYDFQRSGVNSRETELIASAVKARGIKQLFSLGIPDNARGCDASPLVVPGVKLADGRTLDVVLLATMGNWLYAYDAGSGGLLWHRNLGKPIRGSETLDGHPIDQHHINDLWGVVSTPVIQDLVIYGCAWISSDGSAIKGQHFAFAIDVRTGNDVHPLLSLEGATFAPGHGMAPIKFRSAQRKQRSALAVTKGALMIPFGTVLESGPDARGWIIAVDLTSWKVAASWCSTARGSGGGIWMAGAGPAVLPNGDLAFFTGNGEFDAVTDFGESMVRVSYKAAAAGTAAEFSVVDWWTPWTDDGRTGGAAEGEGSPAASNFRKIVHLARLGQLKTGVMSAEWDDMDLGSGGVAYVPSLDLLVGAGKDGVLFAAKAENMGKTRPADLDPARNQANYGKLAFRPIFFTYFAAELDPAPAKIETLNKLAFGLTHHQHGGPICFDSPELGPTLFNWGENENGRAWQLTATGCKYLARTNESASPQAPQAGGGMPGAMLTLTCNGHQPGTAVLWATIPYDDANTNVSAGRLVAYAATEFDNGTLVKLWDSQDWNHQFKYNKFGPAVVANGKLFLPTYDGRVIVYGLA